MTLGMLRCSQDNFMGAQQALQKSLALHPDQLDCRLLLAALLLRSAMPSTKAAEELLSPVQRNAGNIAAELQGLIPLVSAALSLGQGRFASGAMCLAKELQKNVWSVQLHVLVMSYLADTREWKRLERLFEEGLPIFGGQPAWTHFVKDLVTTSGVKHIQNEWPVGLRESVTACVLIAPMCRSLLPCLLQSPASLSVRSLEMSPLMSPRMATSIRPVQSPLLHMQYSQQSTVTPTAAGMHTMTGNGDCLPEGPRTSALIRLHQLLQRSYTHRHTSSSSKISGSQENNNNNSERQKDALFTVLADFPLGLLQVVQCCSLSACSQQESVSWLEAVGKSWKRSATAQWHLVLWSVYVLESHVTDVPGEDAAQLAAAFLTDTPNALPSRLPRRYLALLPTTTTQALCASWLATTGPYRQHLWSDDMWQCWYRITGHALPVKEDEEEDVDVEQTGPLQGNATPLQKVEAGATVAVATAHLSSPSPLPLSQSLSPSPEQHCTWKVEEREVSISPPVASVPSISSPLIARQEELFARLQDLKAGTGVPSYDAWKLDLLTSP
jgi:hypothetical protein